MNIIRTVLFLIIGFLGQYLDASIGMGYGTIAVPLLILLGIPPIYTVPATLLSKTVLGVLSGGIHKMAGNVQRKVVLPLTITGVIGTVLGVPLTFFLPNREVSALIGIILMTTGFLSLLNVARGIKIGRYSQKKIRISGLLAGFVNGISGGGYGAISTTGLISSGINASIAVGSTVLSETAVALSGILLYASLLGEVDLGITLALLIGGAIATPIGALTTKSSPSKKLGGTIGIIVIFLGVTSAYVRFESLILGVVSIASVLIIYYFKMVGILRLRVAIGGINLGIGTLLFSLLYLNQLGINPFHLHYSLEGIFFWGLNLVGAIFIIAGILGVSFKS